jgi:hypothetical protein
MAQTGGPTLPRCDCVNCAKVLSDALIPILQRTCFASRRASWQSLAAGLSRRYCVSYRVNQAGGQHLEEVAVTGDVLSGLHSSYRIRRCGVCPEHSSTLALYHTHS